MTLDFKAGGAVQGTVKCNSLSGDYRVTGGRIIFGELVITTGGCIGWDKRVDRAERTVFPASARSLLSPDGRQLVFVDKDRVFFEKIS